jgi:hydroxymethylpyrimidine pyrophosphatase-like HAD family hydrolase
MAIGDNYNDIPMLSLAGMGIAMENAPVEVKIARMQKRLATIITEFPMP